MAVRLIGVESADPRLPTAVIAASVGTTASDLAAGDTLADAQAYTDAAVAAVEVDTTGLVSVDGDTMTGPLLLAGDPVEDLEAATKAYVDQAIAEALAGIGATGGGPGFTAVSPTSIDIGSSTLLTITGSNFEDTVVIEAT